MAHERIYATQPTGSTSSTDAARPRGVLVQWLPAGDEVGLGVGLLDEPSDSLVGPGTRDDLTLVWLDRAAVNRVIRTLRRARNVAWGADE